MLVPDMEYAVILNCLQCVVFSSKLGYSCEFCLSFIFFHVALNVNIASYEEINLLLQDFLSNENLRSNLVNQCVMTLIHPP